MNQRTRNIVSTVEDEILDFLAFFDAPIRINVGLSHTNVFTTFFLQKSDTFDFILCPKIAIFHTKVAR